MSRVLTETSTCRRGHPWTPETTDDYPLADGGTGRRCAICRRAYRRWVYYAEQGKEVPPALVPRTHAPVGERIVATLATTGPVTIHRLRQLLGYRQTVLALRRRLILLRRRGVVACVRRRGNRWEWGLAS